MKNIAIFASGNGSNAERVALYFKNNDEVNIALILTNRPNAGVLKRAEKLGIPTLVFDRNSFYHTEKIADTLKNKKIDLIILAGFLWLIPNNLLKAYPGKIVNIHPALLPKYGGKGMYGHHVHQAVIDDREKESGITIHYVNENYDEGQVIFQTRVKVNDTDTPDLLANKIHKIEHEYYPVVIKELLEKI